LTQPHNRNATYPATHPREPNQEFVKAFESARQLLGDFKSQESYYLSQEYHEPQVRQDFIDKFFIALGWDVTHERQKNPYEQEVKIENRVKTAGSQRRADYAFFLSPNFRDPKFFAEAKKPSKGLANADDYYQTIRYGWNAGTPIAILTDFEEFHVLDCRYKPSIDDALSHKIESFHYSEYANADKFSRIYYLFSREAVGNGSIEKRSAELPKPRGKAIQRGLFKGGYQPVDEAFLEQLDGYREALAKAFKKANERLQGEELTEAVQRTLDRLVFVRFLEDKQIEEPEIIGLRSRKSAWKGFVSLCRRLEPKYNGLVFKSHRILDGKQFNDPDDNLFADICDELADPASPYNFDQIPISILGSIYERFLGKVVHATPKGVRVEEKPEVRKAGGVYYTPEYIVRYIVRETVRKLIDGKTPQQIADMAFADIACGSGSFLIEVYNQLLEYHLRYYVIHPSKSKKEDVFERDGNMHLTLKKKREILTNNIYGVDIDFQATEVTQLSLYLKLLEDVTMHDAHQFGLFKETILPDLGRNIVCGNSLIGHDIAGGVLFPNADDSKLKAMNFEDAFPKVMKRGGFDAVVGNPPYVRSINLKESNPDQWKILRSSYRSASSMEWDIYLVFAERGLSLLRSNGQLGYILPNKFLNSRVGKNLRAILSDAKCLRKLVHFGAFQIFRQATTYTCLLFLERVRRTRAAVARYTGPANRIELSCRLPEDRPELWKLTEVPLTQLTSANWGLAGSHGFVVEKLRRHPKLETVAQIFQGTGTRADKVYLLEERGRKGDLIRVYSFERQKEYLLEPAFLKRVLRGRSITKYQIVEQNLLLLVPYRIEDGMSVLVPEKELKTIAPNTLSYLEDCRSRLLAREKGRFKGEGWYCYGRPQNMNRFEVEEKIVLPDVSNGANFCLDREKRWLLDTLYSIVLKPDVKMSLHYLLGILNSPLLTAFLKETGTALRGGYFRVKTAYLSPFPIRIINFSNLSDISLHDQIVKLVEQMLVAKEKLTKAKTDAEADRLQLHCAGLDRQLDQAVYELYGLTEEEIKTIEESTVTSDQ
jgi:type I restriction-modification system DNA methylase subunit